MSQGSSYIVQTVFKLCASTSRRNIISVIKLNVVCMNINNCSCSHNSSMSPKKAAGLVIFRNRNRVVQFLLLQTSYGAHHWTPPKGHVDPGESDWITALRETREEAGLSENQLEIYKDISKILKYDVNGKPKVVIYWLAKLINPDESVILSDEHQDMKWLDLKAAQDISGFEDMKKLLAEFYEKANSLL